jgi:hypothetical protein
LGLEHQQKKDTTGVFSTRCQTGRNTWTDITDVFGISIREGAETPVTDITVIFVIG